MPENPRRAHDPYAPHVQNPGATETRAGLDSAYAPFPEDRWRRVGATDADIAALKAVWDTYDSTAQAEEGQYVASQPDPVLAAALDAFRAQHEGAQTVDTTGSGGVDLSKGVKTILDEVGDDAEKAAVVLAAEKARTDREPRSSLVEALERVAAKVATPDPDAHPDPAPEGGDAGPVAAADGAEGQGAAADTGDAHDVGHGDAGEQQKPPATQ